MVQDSKHALKTLRNNLFSGAQLLVLGNYPAMYLHILHIAQGNGTPLYSRDVTKVDRQDDNAAVRLFSEDVLKYLSENHPDYVGEIVYLFIFGELIDAYQNWTMPHIERIKLVPRANTSSIHGKHLLWPVDIERTVILSLVKQQTFYISSSMDFLPSLSPIRIMFKDEFHSYPGSIQVKLVNMSLEKLAMSSRISFT